MEDIRVKNATVCIDGREILHNISWSVAKGERYFILGANGAGKTTLIKMLMGYVWPIYGAEISLLGRRFGETNLVELRKEIAWVSPFIQQWIDPGIKAIEMVLSGIDGTLGFFRNAGRSERETALAMLEKLRAGHLANQELRTLSSGEQVKILIARALLTKPAMVVLDEPNVYLDIAGREFLLDSIRDLALEHPELTILFVTQRIEDILTEFEHGMILKNGSVMASGRRNEVLTEENLTGAFELPIRLVAGKNGRLWAITE